MENGRPNLRALLVGRRDELKRAEQRLSAHLDQVKEELDSIERAARAAGFDLNEVSAVHSKAWWLGKTPEPQAQSSITMKEAATKILDGRPDGLTAKDILEQMHAKYGMNYTRSSLSPQLSRLKHEGLIFQKTGYRWVLGKYAQE